MRKRPSRLRQTLWTLVRLAVTVGAIWYVITQITWKDRAIVDGETIVGWVHVEDGQRWLEPDSGGAAILLPKDAENPDSPVRFVPGIITIFGRLHYAYLVAAILLYPLTVLLCALRWQWLLASHDLHPGYWESLRLTWMGLLVNNVLPGSTGGDLPKAVSIARRSPGKRTSAVMTVFLDRVIGLVALMLVGTTAVLLRSFQDGFDSGGLLVLTMLGICFLLTFLYFGRWARKVFRIEWLLSRIPFGEGIRRIDASLYHYREHPWQLARCLLLSIFIWCWTLVMICLLGQALSMPTALVDYFVYLPLVFTAGAVAPSIAGLGVLEGLFQYFFTATGATAASAVALCLLYRLMMLICSLPGAIPFFAEFSSRAPKQIVRPADEEESPDDVREPAGAVV
jgi:hypothetical protein